jgi:poly(ADP-ribose) glycohydrolase
VLGRGAVQEEILFAISPELVVSCLICEVLLSREALVVRGADRFSDYTGYASDFRWAGPHRGGSVTTARVDDTTAKREGHQCAEDEQRDDDESTGASDTAATAAFAATADGAAEATVGSAAGGGDSGQARAPMRDHLRRSETQLIVIDALMMNRWDMQ